jgi:hypothetical protein
MQKYSYSVDNLLLELNNKDMELESTMFSGIHDVYWQIHPSSPLFTGRISAEAKMEGERGVFFSIHVSLL